MTKEEMLANGPSSREAVGEAYDHILSVLVRSANSGMDGWTRQVCTAIQELFIAAHMVGMVPQLADEDEQDEMARTFDYIGMKMPTKDLPCRRD